MSQTKKSFDRILALLVSIMIVVTIIPMSTWNTFAVTTPEYFTVSVKDTEGNPLTDGTVVLTKSNTTWDLYLEAEIDENGVAVFDSAEIQAVYQAAADAGTLIADTSVVAKTYAKVSGYTYGDTSVVFNSATEGSFAQYIELTLEKKLADIENVQITGKALTYTGSAQELVSVTEVEGDTVEYYLNGATDPATEVPTATDAGTYSVRVVVTRAGSKSLDKTVETVINPADIEGIDIEPVTDLKFNETNQALVTLIGDFDAGDTVTWAVDGTDEAGNTVPERMAVGNYTVTLTVDRGANYNKFEKTVNVEIKLGNLDIGELKVQGLEGVYTGETQNAVTVTGQGDYSLQYKLGDGAWSDTIPTVIEAGSYTVQVKATKTNYNDKDVNIDKAPSAVIPFNVYVAKAEQTGFAFKNKTPSPLAYKCTFENKADGGQTGGLITYEVASGSEYVSVDQTGKITALKAGGNATIKATRAGNSNYKDVTATYVISTVKAVQSGFAFEQAEYIAQYGTKKLTVVAKGGQSNGEVTYGVASEELGIITSADNKGEISFASGKKGEVTVTATLDGGENYENITAEAVVKVLTNDFSDKVIVDTCPSSGWYTDTVTIAPAAGYKISTSGQFDADWKDSIPVATEGEHSPDDVFLKEDATGYISEAIAVEDIYIDKTHPTALKISYSNSIRDIILETISFGFYNSEMTVNLEATDVVSKIDHFVYKIGDGEEVIINKDKINFSGENDTIATASFKIPANLSRSKITLTAFDTAGLSTTIVGDKTLVVDKVKPVVSVSYDNNNESYGSYFQGSRTATITIAEENFFKDNLYEEVYINNENGEPVAQGYNYLTIKVGKRLNNEDDYTYTYPEPEFVKVGNVYKAEVPFTEDADYTFDVVFYDYSLNENAPVDYGTSVAPTAFTVDNTAPVVDISYKNDNAEESPTNDGYFKGSRVLVVTVDEHNFDASELKFTTFKALDVTETANKTDVVDEITAYFKDPANWSCSNDKHVAEYPISTDANYAIELNYSDLADNAAEKETSSFCLDNTKPYVVTDAEISYSASILDTVLNAITFGFYNAKMEVTITAYDETAGIDYFTYLYTLGDDEHQGYVGKESTVIPNSEITFTEDGKKATAKFEISEQFCGYVSFTATDKCGNTSEQFTDVKRIAIDKVAPTVTVEWENKDALKTIGNRKYFDGSRMVTLTIVDEHFIEEGFNPIIEAKDAAGQNVVVNPEYNWVHSGEVHILTIKFVDDANYSFDYTCKDLAGNSAIDYIADEFTIDTNKPYNLKVEYAGDEKSTAGYYDDKVKVTISADDDTSGISQFVYSYVKAEGVSDVNAGMLDVLITENISQDGKTFSADFEIPKEALDENNQFNGYVEFEATDIVNKAKSHKETTNIVVDNISPLINVTYNKPITQANDISYYAGNIEAKIVIDEANFYKEDVVVKVNDEAVDVSWVNDSADVHTGKFELKEDGDYIVTVEYIDRSENKMETYESNRLTIDTTAPAITVSNIKNDSANRDEKYGFTITAKDINIDSASFKPALSAIVLNENGTFETKNISLGDMETVKAGEEYRFTVDNLEDDAIYTLICAVEDMSDNKYEKVVLSDGKAYESVRFSINRDGSTYGIEENTADLIEKYYVQNVTDNVVIFETNADALSEYKVTVNGKELAKDTDYTVTEEGGNGSWMKYTYSINKELFADEGEYKVVVSSKDKAENDAFSDVKDAAVNFVVDRTAPIVTVTGMAKNGRYQTENQKVTLIPTDDGGALKALIVRFVDKDGNVMGEPVIDYTGEALEKALENGAGKIEFTISEGMYQNIQIICNDCAVDEDGNTNTYDVTVTNVTVTPNGFMIFWANLPLRWGSIAGVVVLAAAIVLFVFFKKRKKEEQN